MCKKMICLLSISFVFGLAIAAGADPLQQDTGPDGIVSVEAENFDENIPKPPHEWILVTEPAGFSGAGAMQNTPVDPGGGANNNEAADYVENSPRLDFEVNFTKSGTHYLWIRGYGQDGNSDSCHAGLDGEPIDSLWRYWGFNTSWQWNNTSDQSPPRRTFEIPSPGVHTINIWMREDAFVCDKIVISTNPDYTPTDLGPPESPRGPRFKAYNPLPENGALYFDTWVTLNWSAGDTAASHDVYFGESFDDVNDGAADTFRGNQTATFLVVGFPGFAYPDGLTPGTIFYWRVDEVEADGTTHKGDIWSFSIPPQTAYNPSPADGASFVDPEGLILSWTGGLGVKLHHVYFGDDPDVVANAVGAPPQSEATFDPGPLDLGKTYYWRVDEFDAATTYKGDVWSFTTLPDIPIDDPNLAGWWKFEAGSGTIAIDFSGHKNNGTLEPGSMGSVQWVPGMFNLALEFPGDDQGWVELPAGMVTTAQGSILMWVNTDQTGNEGMFWYGTEGGGDGFGGQNEIHIHNDDSGAVGFAIEGEPDIRLSGPTLAGAGWNHVAATWDQTDGCALYFNGEEVDTQTHTGNIADLATIRLGRPVDTGNGNRYHDGLLDDVRLFDIAISADQVNEIMTKGEDPLRAGAPSPRNNAVVDIDVATPLSWSAGEMAAEHDVYFGLDQDAVAGADATDATGVYRGRQSGTTFTPAEGVEWGGGPYYWRIDEINTDGTITAGGIWSFTVADFILVDNFESYTDNDAEGEAIWQHWIDGFGVPANGSQVGYLLPPYAEQTIVNSGGQSIPLLYNNTGGITNSEAVLTLTAPRDWTRHGVEELSLWFRGLPASVGSFVEGPVGTYTMTAEGADIWNQADEFHYAYKTLTGAGSIEVQVLSVQNTNAWAKAGVMIRETLDAGSKFAGIFLTPGNGTRFQARTGTDIAATSDTPVATAEQIAITAPSWVKLERSVSGAFRGYYSSDGANWQPMAWNPQTILMDSDVYIGLALTSHSAGVVCEAEFSNVRTSGTVAGQWQNQDIGIASNAAEPLYVSIANASGSPAVVAHSDPAAAQIDVWTEWRIPLQSFADQGINLGNVDKIAIGLGSQSGMASSGGEGTIYIDDLRLYRQP